MSSTTIQTTTRKPMAYAIYPSLAGKRVMITGGGTGIGAALVDAFAKQGAHVFFIDIAARSSNTICAARRSRRPSTTAT